VALSGHSKRNAGSKKKRITALAHFVAGTGPQPPEGVVSAICDSFMCTPEDALRQNWRLVTKILDYRLAIEARDIHNEDAKKMKPHHVKIWKEMFSG